MNIAGVILAGGRSERMGGIDKSFALLDGRPLISHVVERLRPQVDRLAISANGDPKRFANFDLPVVPDRDADQSGPLAGILSAMEWTQANVPGAQWLLSAPTDTPFLPSDLARRLAEASSDTSVIRVAQSRGQLHQVVALWPISAAAALARWLETGSRRAVRAWLDTQRFVAVPFAARLGVDPFQNINTPEDLARAELPYLESAR